jgi:fibronectin type III domain protein
MTTLLVCLLQRDRQSAALRALVLALAILTCSMLSACGSGGGGAGGGDTPAAGNVPAGNASASLAWDPVPDVVGYIVHYGTSTPGSPGSCSYAQSTFSSSPSAMITGLAENTTYYFTVSAYNGLESACSTEVSTVTGSA